jgi:elongator complex protein 3
MLERAEAIARERGYHHLAVISAIGTRGYYLERGFERGELYLVKRFD